MSLYSYQHQLNLLISFTPFYISTNMLLLSSIQFDNKHLIIFDSFDCVLHVCECTFVWFCYRCQIKEWFTAKNSFKSTNPSLRINILMLLRKKRTPKTIYLNFLLKVMPHTGIIQARCMQQSQKRTHTFVGMKTYDATTIVKNPYDDYISLIKTHSYTKTHIHIYLHRTCKRTLSRTRTHNCCS